MAKPVQDQPTNRQTSASTAQSEISWLKKFPNLDEYYHDYHIYDKDGHALFVSATLTDCSMGPGHSHEGIYPNSCPHKTPLLHFELTPAAWEDTVFDEKTGLHSRLHWDPNLDVKSLTHLNFKSLAEHTAVSSPGRTFTAHPSAILGVCPPFEDSLIYPKGLDRTLPIFRPTSPKVATHLFVKIPWRPKKDTPKRIEIVRYIPLPDICYWCAINDYYRIGVDYWLVPLAEKPPAS